MFYEKIITEKFLSGVGWFANIHNKHVRRKNFKDQFQDILNKIVGIKASNQMEIDTPENKNKTIKNGEWKKVTNNKQRVPGFIPVTHRVWFKHNGTTFQTTAIEIQNNPSDFKKMQKIMSEYNKQAEAISKFIPSGLGKARTPTVYARIIQY